MFPVFFPLHLADYEKLNALGIPIERYLEVIEKVDPGLAEGYPPDDATRFACRIMNIYLDQGYWDMKKAWENAQPPNVYMHWVSLDAAEALNARFCAEGRARQWALLEAAWRTQEATA